MSVSNLIYNVKDRPPFPKMLLSAFQQVLAIIAGTIAVPMIVGNGMSQSAALLGAAIGTIVYSLITRFKSPVFLGSSFSFIGAMAAAFAGATSMTLGYIGLIFGAIFSGLVYVLFGIAVKFFGTKWIDKLMPPVIIGPTVAIIGLTLAPNAIRDLLRGNVLNDLGASVASPYACLTCGLVALIVTIVISVYGKKMFQLVPFLFGIFAGYLVALVFTLIGNAYSITELQIIDFSPLYNIDWTPNLAFLNVVEGFKNIKDGAEFAKYLGIIALAYVPVAVATSAEHIADHKNLSFIIGHDLLKDPGLHRTFLGDGIGSMVGAMFGGCPNTTYGESIACIGLSKNASIFTTITACILSILIAFFAPLMALLETIPHCVVGGLCVALFGYIAASGFQILRQVDLGEHKNIFIVSIILVFGIGGLAIQINQFVFSPIACALVVGILVNLLVNIKPRKKKDEPEEKEDQ